MKNKNALWLIVIFALLLAAFAAMNFLSSRKPPLGNVHVVKASDVKWEALNPLRGDKSPKAGTLWGKRKGPVPSGFLVKFIDGFSSPPHIHPVTYRGVVISGEVHNDDPKAEKLWLPSGTFWTQPAGDVHITAAKGETNVAYIEIEKGPYLVLPSKEAFEGDEQPVWMKPADMAWANVSGATDSSGTVQVATLPGNPHDETLKRVLVKLAAGAHVAIKSRGASVHAAVIQGRLSHEVEAKGETNSLEPGSYFGSDGVVDHKMSCGATEGCLVYVRSEGTIDIAAMDAGS